MSRPATKQTLFMGETLRSNLLNAYGWWTVETYTIFGAIGLILAALVVLGALVFEVFAARQPREVRVTRAAA